METNQNTTGDLSDKKFHSKLDTSGTDPNRYGDYYSVEDAEKLNAKNNPQKCKSLIPGMDANVSKLERIIMITAGSYLLYKAFSGKRKSIGRGIAGGAMLARGISGYCPVYDAAHKSNQFKGSNVTIHTSITIDKPVMEVYDFWRNLENMPKFMKHIESVKEINKTTSEWKASGPAGIGSISWKANILMDERGKQLSWHSLPDSTIDNAGKITFSDNGNNGTDLEITISYHAPLGVAGEAAAKLLNPYFEKMVLADIESLKSYLETDQQSESGAGQQPAWT